jgi:hypothetical protein
MEIREDGASVIVDGRVISGFLAADGPCQFCRAAPSVYVDAYDAYACPSCDRWLEEACSDPACDRCSRRPTTPFGEGASRA